MLGIPLGNLTHLDGFCSSKDGFPRWHSSNESTYQCRRHKRHRSVWILKIPCRRKWQPSPVFLLGKSHRQTSLVTKSRKQLSNWEQHAHIQMHCVQNKDMEREVIMKALLIRVTINAHSVSSVQFRLKGCIYAGAANCITVIFFLISCFFSFIF